MKAVIKGNYSVTLSYLLLDFIKLSVLMYTNYCITIPSNKNIVNEH